MLTRTHFFVFMLITTVSYGFYIITADDDFRYSAPSAFDDPAGGEIEDDGFVPRLSLPQAVAVLDDDDIDYMDRINRLQHALKVKRSVIAQADAYSQNIRPVDLDGLRLVRAPVVSVYDEDEDYADSAPVPARVVTKRDGPAPFSYIVVD